MIPIVIICFESKTQAQEGIAPIPARELYGEDFNAIDLKVPQCNPENFTSFRQYEKCWKTSIYHKDYGCRYHTALRPRCHCCGSYYHYIEHGPVCTKFCLNEDFPEPNRKYGDEMIIITLPFNWGWDSPEKITLEDGTEVPVKCDQFDGGNYGCNDANSDGFRKQGWTKQAGTNKAWDTKEKLKISPKTRPPKTRRTTTIKTSHFKGTSAGNEIYQTTLTSAETWRTTKRPKPRSTTKQTPRTSRRTTTKRTTTIRTTSAARRVPFALGPSPILKNINGSIKTTFAKKTTTVSSFGSKLRKSSTDKAAIGNVWSRNKEINREGKETTLVEGLPVWG